MLKQHKNAFLEAIKEFGLDPTLFQAEETNPPINPSNILELKTPIFTIKLKHTSFMFSVRYINYNFDVFVYKFTFFAPEYIEADWSSQIYGFEKLLEHFDRWLRFHASAFIQEQQLPDLWSQIEIYKFFVHDSAITEKTTSGFSEEEKKNLHRSIKEFRSLVLENFDPSQEQVEFIGDQLDYLASAIDRLNRLDWRAVALSTMISIATNLGVDTEGGAVFI